MKVLIMCCMFTWMSTLLLCFTFMLRIFSILTLLWFLWWTPWWTNITQFINHRITTAWCLICSLLLFSFLLFSIFIFFYILFLFFFIIFIYTFTIISLTWIFDNTIENYNNKQDNPCSNTYKHFKRQT